MRILISGAGVAGPALALALQGRGHEVTVVERAPRLRDGGQSVDFRGSVHREVLERLGLWDAIWERRTHPSPLAFIDARGRGRALLPAVLTAGDVEIVRGDLSRLLHARTAATTSYRFGDQVTALRNVGPHVEVAFASGRSERFDLVVGADGLHSGVRSVAFGDESQYVRHHGYALATWSFPRGALSAAVTQSYAEPGRSLTVTQEPQGRARALLIFTSPPPPRGDARAQRDFVRERFLGAGWECDRVLAELDEAKDLYLDALATVHVDRYASGRVVLLGDAAWGGTLGGQGTPLALVGAWVLANELAQADVRTALAEFERRMRPYASGCQKNAERAGPFHAPKTRLGIGARNVLYRVLTSRLLAKQFERMVKASANDFVLPGYPALAPPGRRGRAAP